MKIIFVRHGKDNKEYRGGWSSIDLTHEGILQSEKLAEYLTENKEVYNISYVVSSDLKRAITTSKIIAKMLDVSILEEKSLREINNGNLSNMLNQEVDSLYPGLYFNSLKMDEKYPNGESPNEFYERIKTWFNSFLNKHKNDRENILVVTHAGVINIIYHIVNGIEWNNKNKTFKIPECSINILNTDIMNFENTVNYCDIMSSYKQNH